MKIILKKSSKMKFKINKKKIKIKKQGEKMTKV